MPTLTLVPGALPRPRPNARPLAAPLEPFEVVVERAVTVGWTLVGPDGVPHRSGHPGTLGGHRRSRLYGRLDCPAALRAIARGGYLTHRVFFADRATARSAGYRPCAVCLPDEYTEWKAGRSG